MRNANIYIIFALNFFTEVNAEDVNIFLLAEEGGGGRTEGKGGEQMNDGQYRFDNTSINRSTTGTTSLKSIQQEDFVVLHLYSVIYKYRNELMHDCAPKQYNYLIGMFESEQFVDRVRCSGRQKGALVDRPF